MNGEIIITLEQVEKFLAEELRRQHGLELVSYGFVEQYRDGSGEGPLNTGGTVFFKATTK